MDINGLTQSEVEKRKEKGLVNTINNTKTKSIKEIVLSNIFTYFNILNILLAAAILVSCIIFDRFFYSLKNCLFLGVIVCNTVISIVQEITSKKTIDKLSIISSIKPKVLRDGKIVEILPEEIVMDDVIKYTDKIDADNIYFQYAFKEPYIYILFYNKCNPKDFSLTAKYKNDIKSFDSVISFGKYRFYLPNEIDDEKNTAYVMKKKEENHYNINENIWKKTYIDDFLVLERKVEKFEK